MYTCVHICVNMYVCICMYMYICIFVYMYAYICISHTCGCVHMHSCRRISFICTVQSLYYMRVYHRCFLILACVGGGRSEVIFSPNMFMVSACCWRRRLCFGRGRDRGFFLYISLFLLVLGWCVGVRLYTHIHTHKLLGYLM